MSPNEPLIAIVGDGIAAQISVLALQQQGLRTVLIRNQQEPRYPSWPESIDANGIDLLSELVDTHELLNKCQYPLEVKHSCWGNDLLITKLNQRLNQTRQLTHLVNKQRLLEYLGGEVMKASLVEAGPVCSARSSDGAVILQTASGAEIICDATIFAWGKEPILQELSQAIATDALHGRHWILKNPSCTDIDIEAFSIVEACCAGWWYGVRLPNNSMSLLFMTDSEQQHAQEKPLDFLVKNLNHTLHLKGFIHGHGLSQISASNQFNHFCRHRTTFSASFSSQLGPFWFAVGDAAISLDPLSAFGLTSAIWSAIQAARRMKQCFQGEAMEASRAYQKDMQHYCRTIISKRTEIYREEERFKDELFWSKRHLHPLSLEDLPSKASQLP
jgi:2-polyprenyl-6-methoxyphenol hydroxylase-like FAD-dependent oxidoreductase